MPALITSKLSIANANHAPSAGAIIWRWLVQVRRNWAKQRKIQRDAQFLHNAPQSILDDIGIDRQDIELVCRGGRLG
ncbi:hypothetical protein [Thalassospira sp.]|uniref:hypothetical protein n=1 Tax=Thalassospira sp. TaxID=1912094 RepID=UPI000C48DA4B|nr:hypothetical protein [Thalassospira sp.]MBC04909.1 hypothetical protein [Thalassospira sp.]|tara:strand:- start:963 stop:1193 length:231 start_codon:yes stop_codon:yes gene_type:complete